MRKIIVDKDKKTVVDYLLSKFNKLKRNTIYKALRNKDIRVNDIKISENIMLNIGDELTIYIKDDVLFGSTLLNKKQIVYDDDNIIIVYKPQNMLVISEKDDIGLDKMVNDYLNSDAYPCHRLDRNTAGLVIFAKDRDTENLMLKMIKEHCLRKFYKCTVYGKPKNKRATLTAYLFKDSKNSLVIISDEKKKGYQEIITKYNVISYNDDNTSDLEVELVTRKNTPDSCTFSTYWLPNCW